MNVVQICSLRKILSTMSSYYAVAKGRVPGIYKTWGECKAQVHHYSGPIYKKFQLREEAESFIKAKGGPNVQSTRNSSKLAMGKRSLTCAENKKLPKKKPRLANSMSSKSICIKQGKSPEDFTVDADGYVHVYTDGACSSNGCKGAKAGIGVWFGDGHPLNVSKPIVGRATNNNAEIQAVTAAAMQAKSAGITKLQINTDSQFLISCITKWMPTWKRNGWKSSTKQDVINKIELLEMEKAIDSLTIEWNHINGHVGIYGNEMADSLAKAGAEKYVTVPTK